MKYPQGVSMPSAVSDWLEEQLEARGIDSEVYTRYILSLLHAHALDFIFPEDDFSFSGLRKNAKRNAVSQKRLRRTQNNSSWWRRHAEAEQIKRSAAVECLMSAADQSCEIESLVDELCEKLKEINSESNHTENINQKTSCENRNVTSKELAERYYAAFPPLYNREDDTYFSSNINLVAGKWSSPNKNQIDLIAAKWNNPSGSPKKSKKRTKRQCNENMKSASRANKFGHKRTYSGRNLVTGMDTNVVNWELICNNNYQTQDQCLVMNNSLSQDIDMLLCDVNGNDSPVCRMEIWLQSTETEKNYDLIQKSIHYQKNTEKFIALYPTSIWSDNEKHSHNLEWRNFVSVDNENTGEEVSAIRKEYQRRRFESIVPKVDKKEEVEEEEEEECAIKKEYHTRRNSSDHQWNADYNETMTTLNMHATATVPNHQIRRYVEDFGLASDFIQKTSSEDDELEQNEKDKEKRASLLETFLNLSDEKSFSLIKVNHSMESSAFCEYVRPLVSNEFVYPIKKSSPSAYGNELEENKRTPPHMYFEPIKPVPVHLKLDNANAFQDGSTFIIDSNVSEVKFKRSESGTLHLEGDLENRKYFEYHWRPSTEEYFNMPISHALSRTPADSFNIKYRVSTNDKSCQTVDGHRSPQSVDDPFIESVNTSYDELQSVTLSNAAPNFLLQEYDTELLEGELMFAFDTAERPKSIMCESDEVVWGDQPKSSNVFCKYCNGQHPWLNNCGEWNERSLKHIWAGTESCGSCPWMNRPPTQLVETSSRLREESREEGERLLSDLNSLQLSFSSNLFDGFASISQNTREEPIEKKRRHSYMSNTNCLWSFATRLQEDCLFNLSTLPTRRSVTL